MQRSLVDCIEDLQKERSYDAILYMTPDGERYNQVMRTSSVVGQHYDYLWSL